MKFQDSRLIRIRQSGTVILLVLIALSGFFIGETAFSTVAGANGIGQSCKLMITMIL